MSENNIAVVILNWNTRDMLKRYLPEVIRHSRFSGASIVVADNGSNDGSCELIEKDFPEVQLIKLDKNYGFAGGYNRAIKRIKAKYSVLLNSDVIPSPNWLSPLFENLETSNNIAAAVPKIKSLKAPTMFEYAGAAGGFIDKWGYTFCRGRIFDSLEQDEGQYSNSGDIFWGSGAALMVRTELFNQTGGLNEHFFAHMEEIDWCWRMKNLGMQIQYVPDSEVFHLGGGTLSAMSSHKTYLNFRNNLFLLYRNLPDKGLHQTLFFRLLLDGVAALKFFISGDLNNLKAIFRAHRDYFRRKPFLREERTLLRKDIRKENHKEIYQGSIIWDYFIRGKKHFGELNFPDIQNKL
ncbi:glycosyltransferase family 2 protein [Marinilabilia rubra]|uniref:Glycosyl transferase family 2 n=1 Tax=Marinilabilia rubra TaxID=2162893 RepID=A0A2U2BA34_9BACT|nr:glycosyltransferase family 2 protein [Marinilabilia rubra]PWD99902.1 glycosyl transferase family 2 [Marinilabilia rubra]